MKKADIKRFLAKEGGYALATVSFVLVGLTVVGLAGILVATLDIDISGARRLEEECFAVAEGGLQQAMAQVIGASTIAGSRVVPGIITAFEYSTTKDGQRYRWYSGHYDSPGRISFVALPAMAIPPGFALNQRLLFTGLGCYRTVVTAICPNNAQKELEVAFCYGIPR